MFPQGKKHKYPVEGPKAPEQFWAMYRGKKLY
jgi:hypothetical protein